MSATTSTCTSASSSGAMRSPASVVPGTNASASGSASVVPVEADPGEPAPRSPEHPHARDRLLPRVAALREMDVRRQQAELLGQVRWGDLDAPGRQAVRDAPGVRRGRVDVDRTRRAQRVDEPRDLRVRSGEREHAGRVRGDRDVTARRRADAARLRHDRDAGPGALRERGRDRRLHDRVVEQRERRVGEEGAAGDQLHDDGRDLRSGGHEPQPVGEDEHGEHRERVAVRVQHERRRRAPRGRVRERLRRRRVEVGEPVRTGHLDDLRDGVHAAGRTTGREDHRVAHRRAEPTGAGMRAMTP